MNKKQEMQDTQKARIAAQKAYESSKAKIDSKRWKVSHKDKDKANIEYWKKTNEAWDAYLAVKEIGGWKGQNVYWEAASCPNTAYEWDEHKKQYGG